MKTLADYQGTTMGRTQPQTPLAELVIDRMADFGIEPVDVVERLGFANQAKGLRRLNGYLDTGQEDSHLLQSLPEVLGLKAVQVEAAAAATRQQIAEAQEAAAKKRFRPHIQVLAGWPDGKRMPFFIQAFAYGQTVLPMPDGFDRLSSARQVRQAARTVRRHFGDNRGTLSAWGTIDGYRLQRTFDHAVVLNTDGTVREGSNREPEPPPPELQIKGKRLPMGIFTGK